MSYKNVKAGALGHLMVACLGPPTSYTSSTTRMPWTIVWSHYARPIVM